MQQRPHRRSRRARWAPYLLGPVAVALVVGVCLPVVLVAPQVSGATTGSGGSLSGSFATYLPGEQWGGGNPGEKCVSCTATSLIGEDSAESIQQGQPVNPATGDFTTHADLFSVPTAAGTFGLDLTYDAQRAISEGLDPSGYPYEDPGPFGWGWQSALSASLVNSNTKTAIQVNEANGSELEFHAIGTTTGDIDADECPWKDGFYPDWQKTTVPGSTVAYCAASRVNAAVGTSTTFHTYHLRVDGGTELLTFDQFGQLTEEGNLQNPDAVAIAHGVSKGHTGCPNVGPTTTTCDIENDLVAQSNGVTRRIVTEIDGLGVATSVFAPTGAGYTLGHNGDADLTSVTNPTGDVTHYGYAATGGTQGTGYKNELTSITDADGNTSQIVYATGMVTELSDPNDQETTYSYTTTKCATLSGCFKTDASQATTVTYDDGETDRDYYEGGVLLTDCYGPGTNTCTSGADWGFNYLFDTGGMAGGTNKETVNMPEGAQATIVTDAADDVVAYTDPNGGTSHELWNDTGGNDFNELCWSVGPETSVSPSATCSSPPTWATRYTYDADGQRLSASDQSDNVTHYGYYDNGLLCWTAPPSVSGGGTCANGGSTPSGAPAGSTAYRYNPQSDLTQKTVAYGTGTVETTTYDYDLDGRVTDVIPPDGQGHGAFGSNPYETTTTYRASGLVQTTVAPDSLTTAYTYDADGNVLTETTPSGVTTTAYDKENRACWTHVGAAKVTGSCTSRPSGSVSTTYLATTSAPATVTNQEGQTTSYTYADPVYPTKATKTADPMGDEMTYAAYTLYGQTCISGPVSPGACTSRVAGDTWATYGADGQVTSTTDPSDTTTTYTYGNTDFPTQPSKMTYGAGGADPRAITYTYRPDGQLMFEKDTEGHVTALAYNANDELCMVAPVVWLQVCTPPSATGATQYTYNAAGERTTMTDNYGTANAVTDHYTYDPSGHLLSATTDNGRTTAYQYNDAGQVACIAYPVKSGANCADSPSATNTVVTHTYNGAGELDKTTDWLGNATSYSGYTPKGEVGEITYPSTTGESLTYHYDTAGALTAEDYTGPALGSVADSYGINNDTQLSSVTGLHGFSSPSDTYNGYGRVATASAPTSPTASTKDTFSYNANGTIASITPASGPTQTDAYNTLEELTTQTAPTITEPVGKGITTVGSPISVGVNPIAVAVAPNGSSTYVVDLGRFLRGQPGTVAVVTGANHRTKSITTVGYGPTAIAINPSGTTAYVSIAMTHEILPITISTGKKEKLITGLGTDEDSIAITPNGAKAYVASELTDDVTPVTLSTGALGGAVTVGIDPTAIVITSKGTTAYVANNGSKSVTPITLANGTAGSTITVGISPQGIAVNPSGTKVYVAGGSHTVVPVTLATKTKEAAVTVGTGPWGIVLTPSGTTAFVTNWISGSVSEVTLVGDVVATTAIVGTGAFGLGMTSNGKRLYVAVEDETAVVPITLTTRDVSYSPYYGYNADGDRCWSAPGTGTGPCTAAPANATSYGWNHYNQICWSGPTTDATAGCTAPPSGTTTYRYNGTGLRTKETPPSGSALAFTYDTVTSTTPQDIDDGTYAYIYGPSGTAPVEQINLTTGAASFLSSTPTGVQTVFSSSGSLQEEAAYSPYGTQEIQQGSKATPFGFQGTYTTASGLDYMVNRYYTPTSAEFLSVDPMLGSTHQPYAFANGDPLNESDPLGLKGWYCVDNYKGHSGYTSHYFQGTNYGAPNGKCGTFLSWLSYQTQTTIQYFEFIAALGSASQGPTLLGGGLMPPVASSATTTSEPSASSIFSGIGNAAVSAVDNVGHAVATAAGSAYHDIHSVATQNPTAQWLNNHQSCIVQGAGMAILTLASGGGDAIFIDTLGTLSYGGSQAIAAGFGGFVGCKFPPTP